MKDGFQSVRMLGRGRPSWDNDDVWINTWIMETKKSNKRGRMVAKKRVLTLHNVELVKGRSASASSSASAL